MDTALAMRSMEVLTKELDRAIKQRDAAVAALKEASEYLSLAKRHNCAGFDCAICNFSGLLEAMESAITFAKGE